MATHSDSLDYSSDDLSHIELLEMAENDSLKKENESFKEGNSKLSSEFKTILQKHRSFSKFEKFI